MCCLHVFRDLAFVTSMRCSMIITGIAAYANDILGVYSEAINGMKCLTLTRCRKDYYGHASDVLLAGLDVNIVLDSCQLKSCSIGKRLTP